MILMSPSEPIVMMKTFMSHAVDGETSSSAVLWMASSVMESLLFSTTKLIACGLDLARVFNIRVTLCEHGSITANSAKVCQGIDTEQSSTPTLSSNVIHTWQQRVWSHYQEDWPWCMHGGQHEWFVSLGESYSIMRMSERECLTLVHSRWCWTRQHVLVWMFKG